MRALMSCAVAGWTVATLILPSVVFFSLWGIPERGGYALGTAVFVVFLLGFIIFGGVKRIAHVTQVIVPLMALGYILMAVGIILIWPLKAAVKVLTVRGRGKAKVKRLVVLGLDGFAGHRRFGGVDGDGNRQAG